MKRRLTLVIATAAVLTACGSSSHPTASDGTPWFSLPTHAVTPSATATASPSTAPPRPTARPRPTPTPTPTPAYSVLPTPPDTVASSTPDGLIVAVYTVRSGDWLSKLALRYGSQVTDIFQWSKGNLGPNPDQIYPGDLVVVKVLGYR